MLELPSPNYAWTQLNEAQEGASYHQLGEDVGMQ